MTKLVDPLNTSKIQPGIYSISSDVYHQGAGLSRSALMAFKRSPYHYWYQYLNPDYVAEPPTPAQLFGNALHSYILEPDKFEQQFYVLPKLNKRTKAGNEQWQQIQAEIKDKTTITTDQYHLLQAMQTSLQKNKLAMQLIEKAAIEQSLYWTDSETGILCKCRPDIINGTIVADLKTACDGRASVFQQSILNYGYHLQAAMMREALLIVKNINVESFIFIVIEKSAPYATVIYQLDQVALDKGQAEFKALLHCYKHCLDTDCWPAYNIQEISLPRYAFT